MSINALSPSTGDVVGGERIVLEGQGFTFVEGVLVGGKRCENMEFNNNFIVCETPSVPNAGQVSVIVYAKGNRRATSTFTYTADETSITSILPRYLKSDVGGELTILGEGFSSGLTVTVGGSPCNSVNVVNSTKIKCSISPQSVGSHAIVVTLKNGTTITSSEGVYFTGALSVTNVSPSTGPSIGGTVITVTGINFTEDSIVRIGSGLCEGTSVNASLTQITCTTPEQSGSHSEIWVYNPDLTSAKNSTDFVYNAQPVANGQTVNSSYKVNQTITLTGSDAENNPLTYTIVGSSTLTYGTLTGTPPNLTYVLSNPGANAGMTDSFTFKVNDGSSDSAVATVNINIVNNIPNTPAALNCNPSSPIPGTTEQPCTLTQASPTDPDMEPVAYLDSGSTCANPVINIVTGAATYTAPAKGIQCRMKVKANDSVNDSKTVISNVITGGNTVPVANNGIQMTDFKEPKEIILVGTDADTIDTLTYAIVSQPSSGVVRLVDNVATYYPSPDFIGDDSFTFKVNDGTDDSNTATISVSVNKPTSAFFAGQISSQFCVMDSLSSDFSSCGVSVPAGGSDSYLSIEVLKFQSGLKKFAYFIKHDAVANKNVIQYCEINATNSLVSCADTTYPQSQANYPEPLNGLEVIHLLTDTHLYYSDISGDIYMCRVDVTGNLLTACQIVHQIPGLSDFKISVVDRDTIRFYYSVGSRIGSCNVNPEGTLDPASCQEVPVANPTFGLGVLKYTNINIIPDTYRFGMVLTQNSDTTIDNYSFDADFLFSSVLVSYNTTSISGLSRTSFAYATSPVGDKIHSYSVNTANGSLWACPFELDGTLTLVDSAFSPSSLDQNCNTSVKNLSNSQSFSLLVDLDFM